MLISKSILCSNITYCHIIFQEYIKFMLCIANEIVIYSATHGVVDQLKNCLWKPELETGIVKSYIEVAMNFMLV
jgi:hypothetical protein